MRIRDLVVALFSIGWAVGASASGELAAGPDIHDTRLLSEPAVSADRLAFIYAGDL